jgi:hypothetical protein
LLPFEDRYTRQRQLKEVGVSGQERIAAHTAAIPAGPSAPVAVMYLQRAGVSSITTSAPSTARRSEAAFEAAGAFSSELAREYGRGCLIALAELRAALGMCEAIEQGEVES